MNYEARHNLKKGMLTSIDGYAGNVKSMNEIMWRKIQVLMLDHMCGQI